MSLAYFIYDYIFLLKIILSFGVSSIIPVNKDFLLIIKNWLSQFLPRIAQLKKGIMMAIRRLEAISPLSIWGLT